MSFGDLLADLDDDAFAELADDNAAIWEWYDDNRSVPISVMLDHGERSAFSDGLTLVSQTTVVRISVSGLAKAIAATPNPPPAGIGEFARRPVEGETIKIKGRIYVVHGTAWLDPEMDGRDWLCAVSASD